MKIYVAAGGNGTRMQAAIEELGYGDLPKHLLPTYVGGPSLLERAVEIATNVSDEVAVLANNQNYRQISSRVRNLGVPILRSTQGSPLGPFSYAEHIPPMETAMSIAGDVYIERPRLKDFMASHAMTAGTYPISFMVGRVHGHATNAIFDVSEDGRIEQFYRLADEKPNVLRNIGVYIFTLSPPVVEILQSFEGFEVGQEDRAATELISAGLVKAFEHTDRFFNINNRADYEAMLAYTAVSAVTESAVIP